jgi:hypothetical protein
MLMHWPVLVAPKKLDNGLRRVLILMKMRALMRMSEQFSN